ncbi:hypothetical protein CHS0354_004116 [Potamilus streckersoni]|uniref:C1q domain-containing protein n=1 Tax=Potamilus streckersoni TaxID=2493646 RepID=A0AAE0VXT1_9BIVA|nr:hypothetical protein CHS0354_004116 [Potamilus streckersoni]
MATVPVETYLANIVVFLVLVTCACGQRSLSDRSAMQGECSRFDYEHKLLERLVVMELAQKTVDEAERKLWDGITELQKELKTKGKEIADLNAAITQLRMDMNTGFTKMTSPVIFKVKKSPFISASVSDVILFDNVETNVGDAFRVDHGFFRAPVAGTYSFALQVCCYPKTWVSYDIKVRGQQAGETRAGDSNFYDCSTEVTVHTLAVGNEVWVQHRDGNGVDKHWATFSGVLLNTANVAV